MVLRHVFSNAIADGTNTQIVRPSDWNSAHNLTQNLGGNTAGVSSVAGTDIVWAGGNNVTLSANGSTVSIHGADTTQFLTTAALSNHSHGNPTLALTNISGTTASNSAGLTLSLSGNDVTQFLTTAALSNHSHGNPTLALTNISGTTASNSAGLTLSLSAAAPGGGTEVYFTQPFPVGGNYTTSNAPLFAASVNTVFVYPFDLSASLAISAIALPVSITNSSTNSSSGQVGLTCDIGFYTQGTNTTKIDLLYSTSYTIIASNSSDASRAVTWIDGIVNSTSYSTNSSSSAGTALSSLFHGGREFQLPFQTTLAPGRYWAAMRFSQANSGSSNGILSVNVGAWRLDVSQPQYRIGSASNNASITGGLQMMGIGNYSVTSASIPASLGFSELRFATHYPLIQIRRSKY